MSILSDNVAKAFEMCNSQQAELSALRKQLAERDSELQALEKAHAEMTECCREKSLQVEDLKQALEVARKPKPNR